MKKLLLAFLLILPACQTPAPEGPDINFTNKTPIYLNVARINVIEEYKSPMQLPNVEHLIPESPAEAMHTWVSDRLRSVGTENSMQVIIKDASVVVSYLDKPGGMHGFFTDSPDKKYDAHLEVELRIYGEEGAMSEANVSASVSRSVTINESASLAERSAILKRLIYDLMQGLNAQLEQNMYMYFGKFITYSHSP